MIFSELYSAYYNAVAEILKDAIDHPLQGDELRKLVEKHAFGESIWNIERSLFEEKWQLIFSDGTTPILKEPTMPLTTMQKRWLKAIVLDPRIRLFQDEPVDWKIIFMMLRSVSVLPAEAEKKWQRLFWKEPD